MAIRFLCFFPLVGIVIVAAATDAWQLCRNYEAALLQINHATRCQRCGHFVTFNYSRESERKRERERPRERLAVSVRD